MGRIKSAWEIALEKTADIQLDEAKYKETTLTDEGKSLVGKFLMNPEMPESELREKYSSYSEQDRKIVRKGIVSCIISNISLPSDNAYKLRFERLCTVASVIAEPESGVEDTMMQTRSFMEQYLDAREEFVNRMQEQITQMMRQDPRADRSQYAKAIEQQLAKMENQYKSQIDNFRQSLADMLA